MKRKVTFSDETKNQKRFELLYLSIILGAPQNRGIEVIRREARILDLLDSISSVNSDSNVKFGTEPGRIINGGAELLLEVADFELIKSRLEKTEWVAIWSRKVVDTLDWFSSATEVKQDGS